MPRLVMLSFGLLFLVTTPTVVMGVESITFRVEDQQRSATGRILVEAQDGGVMLEADDGRIWTLQPEDIVSRKQTDAAFEPVAADELEERMLEELKDGFQVYRTQHYMIVYNSSEGYAKQVGALFEQLYRGFFTYWKNQRWKLPEPEFPLVALVLKDHRSFLTHARGEIGETANSVIGYYHLGSNRMTTFNVPDWERNVATIIHEATHQLAYNCGMQRRFADNPMWVSEGLATFFESPDRRNPGKWRSIGRVNQVNLMRWHKYFPNRPAESLATLLADDMRYRNGGTATAAYAEGWALTYFLIKTKRKEYVAYLRMLSAGKPAVEKTKRQRITEFETAFGMKLVDMDKAFVTYMRRVR
ncbi:MAG: DUF1570 domain-containing protein [Rubripirellula sp.]